MLVKFVVIPLNVSWLVDERACDPHDLLLFHYAHLVTLKEQPNNQYEMAAEKVWVAGIVVAQALHQTW